MTRRERMRLYALIAPAVASVLWAAFVGGAVWMAGHKPSLSSLIEACLFVFVPAQIGMWIWYVRNRE